MPKTNDPSGNQGVAASTETAQQSATWINYIDKSIKYLNVIWDGRRSILKIVVPISLLFALYLYFSPGFYVSTTTILPDLQGLQNLQRRGAIGDLAAAAGLSTGITPSQLFPEIVRSDRILGDVMNRSFEVETGKPPRKIAEIWGLTSGDTSARYDGTLKALRNSIDASLDRRTMIVTLQVTTENAILSAQLANVIVNALDAFTLEFRKKLAGEQKDWIEGRLVEVQRDLARSEEALKQFRERNRNVTSSAQLLLDQARLAREVEINSTIFIELKKQLEVAKIEQAKTTSIVLVLDPARPPYLKSGPARRYVFLAFFATVFLLCVGYVIARHQLRQDPEIAKRLKLIKQELAFWKHS